jgi:hypothetical protein
VKRWPIHVGYERRDFAAGYHHRQYQNLILTPVPQQGFEMHGAAGSPSRIATAASATLPAPHSYLSR